MASDSLKIGRIWGIDVNLHWTFILLMLFILLLGSLSLFIIFLLLFVCVFIHELSHSKTALLNGIKVTEIVLTPIGGASVIDQLSIDPRTEFNISVAGPIMSFLLGGLFGMAAVFSPPGPLTFILQIMFELNIALGVLNILPAFPLDGGRVFRSYLERKYDQFKATVITVKISKYIAGLFILFPIIYLSITSGSLEYKVFEFFIYAIVAFFLYGGAQAELQNTIIRKETKNLTIDKAISRDFVFVSSKTKIQSLYRLVESKGVSTVLTSVNGEVMMLDLFRRRQPNVSLASEIATSVPQLKAHTGMMDAIQRLEASGRGVAVVVGRNKRPIGIVTVQHLNALLSLHMLNRRNLTREKGF